MVKADARSGSLLLRWASLLSGFRDGPILGGFLRWSSRQLVPTGNLIWVRIQEGPAQGLWIRVNSRNGQNFQQGTVEPAVQLAIQRRLHARKTFFDLGVRIGFSSLMASRLVGSSGSVVSFEADPEICFALPRQLKFQQVHLRCG
jgi:hypothetical protein